MGTRLIDVAFAARAYPGEQVSGDAWQLACGDDWCRITVVDGLGHGAQAEGAASAATAALAAAPELDPKAALTRCHQALAGSRGAAVGVALVNVTLGHISFAGVGNIEARLYQGGSDKHLVSARGIVGSTLPTLRAEGLQLHRDWLLVLHTDGVSSRFRCDELTSARSCLQDLADEILAGWGRSHDDAMVVVASAYRERA